MKFIIIFNDYLISYILLKMNSQMSKMVFQTVGVQLNFELLYMFLNKRLEIFIKLFSFLHERKLKSLFSGFLWLLLYIFTFLNNIVVISVNIFLSLKTFKFRILLNQESEIKFTNNLFIDKNMNSFSTQGYFFIFLVF